MWLNGKSNHMILRGDTLQKQTKTDNDFSPPAVTEVSFTVHQACALTALAVRKRGNAGKNPIAEGDFQWIFACNCEGTEQLHSPFPGLRRNGYRLEKCELVRELAAFMA